MTNTDLNIESRAACLLERKLTPQNYELLRQLCSDVRAQLTLKLRRGVKTEDISEIFEGACAMFAAAMFLELKGAAVGSVSGFTAGKVSVQLGGKTPETLRRCALDMLGAYIDTGGFEFMGVTG